MKKLQIILILALGASIGSCNLFKKKQDPDPLANAAGTYVGTMQDNTAIIQNARANVTTGKNGNTFYVSSVGITSSTYQLVLTGVSNSDRYFGSRNGTSYEGRVTVNGQTLNITGSYRLTTSSPTLNFSFTGTKQ